MAAYNLDKTDISCYVGTITDLPVLAFEPNIPNGFLVFVKDEGAFYVAKDGAWVTPSNLPSTITYDYALLTWGDGNNGKLGIGVLGNRSIPTSPAGGGTNWSQVSAGYQHMGAVKTDGTLWMWGSNNNGQVGNGVDGTSYSSPITTAGGGTNWIQVSCAFDNFTAAVKSDGTLWTWGANSYGQLGINNTTSIYSPVTTAGGGTNWKQVSAGSKFTAAIKTDGTLWTWGYGYNWQLGSNNISVRSSPGMVAGGGTDWAQVSAGITHTAAVKTDGTLWTWGTSSEGGIGANALFSRSSPGTVAGGGTTWKQVSAGGYLVAAIKTDGTLWTWGANWFGQLGNGTTSNRSSPNSTVGGGTDWSSVSCGAYHISATKTDGKIYTVGRNNWGQLGNGTTINRSSPVTVTGGITTWTQVSAGSYHTAGIYLIG